MSIYTPENMSIFTQAVMIPIIHTIILKKKLIKKEVFIRERERERELIHLSSSIKLLPNVACKNNKVIAKNIHL